MVANFLLFSSHFRCSTFRTSGARFHSAAGPCLSSLQDLVQNRSEKLQPNSVAVIFLFEFWRHFWRFLSTWTAMANARSRSDPEKPSVFAAISSRSMSIVHRLLGNDPTHFPRMATLWSKFGRSVLMICWNRLSRAGSRVQGKLVEARNKIGSGWATRPSSWTKNSALHLLKR